MDISVSENAYNTLSNVQFYREIISERLADVSLIILSFYLSLVPYVGTEGRKTYAYFTIVFMYVYLSAFSYDISVTHFINQRKYFSGLQLLDTIYPIPKNTRNIAYLQLLKYITILLQNFIIVSFISRFILQSPFYLLSVYVSMVVVVPIFVLLGYFVSRLVQ